MCEHKKAKPVAGEVEVPSVFECGGDQLVEVPDFESPGIVIVDDLVHGVDGVEVRGNEVACGRLVENFKPIEDRRVQAQRCDVDLKENRAHTTRWRGSPTRW